MNEHPKATGVEHLPSCSFKKDFHLTTSGSGKSEPMGNKFETLEVFNTIRQKLANFHRSEKKKFKAY
jgi:hypothetical protein